MDGIEHAQNGETAAAFGNYPNPQKQAMLKRSGRGHGSFPHDIIESAYSNYTYSTKRVQAPVAGTAGRRDTNPSMKSMTQST
jgi:hypothetical protein